MILLLGASGQVGTAFQNLVPDAVSPPHDEVDLASLTLDRAMELLTEIAPSLVINCAAFTAVDRAEEEPDLATTVNGRAVGVLAAATNAIGVPFVTYSTDYVFDGQGTEPYVESDPTDPINAYGRSKLIGEQLALDANPLALVIRTSWVISGTHPNFVATMLRLASAGNTVRVVEDQRGCPTVADDLAQGTLAVVESGARGLLHLTNRGEATWFELAREAVTLAGHVPSLIEPCSTEEYPTPAKRPAYSVMGSERPREVGLASLPHWRDSLPGLVRMLSHHR